MKNYKKKLLLLKIFFSDLLFPWTKAISERFIETALPIVHNPPQKKGGLYIFTQRIGTKWQW